MAFEVYLNKAITPRKCLGKKSKCRVKCILLTQWEEVCDQCSGAWPSASPGTEKLATDVPGGGAGPAVCPEHVASFHRKGKKNHKPALDSKRAGSPPTHARALW